MCKDILLMDANINRRFYRELYDKIYGDNPISKTNLTRLLLLSHPSVGYQTPEPSREFRHLSANKVLNQSV